MAPRNTDQTPMGEMSKSSRPKSSRMKKGGGTMARKGRHHKRGGKRK